MRRPSNQILTNLPIPTAGETVGDEVFLELIRDTKTSTGLALLHCDGRRRVGARLKIGGKIYVPPNVDTKIARQLRLPIRTYSYGSTRKLFGKIEEIFKTFGP